MIIGKHIAMLVGEGFEDVELNEPLRSVTKNEGMVILIGTKAGQILTGKRGIMKVTIDLEAGKARAADYDGVIIPGGYSPDRLRTDANVVGFVKDAYLKNKIIAAICHGPQLLISADIVRGKRLTSWPSIRVDLENAGAIWLDKRVVRDGNLITSRKPADLPYFNKAIIEALQKPSEGQKIVFTYC
ncbi:MAG: type 1 glutamine amidotransferase [Dehalococcoidia bacterium]|nr:type 1 glutamine amidotransferase [Dehalococcoidia bacterium]